MLPNDTLNQSGDTAVASEARLNQPSAPIQLWLVDDNKPLRESMKDFLGSFEGIRCTATFASPNALLSALASRSGPDVILLDIHMGEANGLDAVRPIKTLSSSTQVLMFTTFNDIEAKTRALSDGASGFLLKRTPITEILASIQHACSHPAPHLRRSSAQREISSRAAECPSKRSHWIKQCLNALRKFRN